MEDQAAPRDIKDAEITKKKSSLWSSRKEKRRRKRRRERESRDEEAILFSAKGGVTWEPALGLGERWRSFSVPWTKMQLFAYQGERPRQREGRTTDAVYLLVSTRYALPGRTEEQKNSLCYLESFAGSKSLARCTLLSQRRAKAVAKSSSSRCQSRPSYTPLVWCRQHSPRRLDRSLNLA